MGTYIIRRTLLIIPTLIIASFMVFLVMRLIPGDIIDLMVSELPLTQQYGSHGTEEAKAFFRESLGLDAPIHVQYVRWLRDIVLHGDLGNSLWNNVPVLELILPRIPVTLELAFLAFAVASIVSLPVAILAATRQDTIGDYVVRSAAILAMSLPVFWTGIMVMVFPSIWWRWSPPIFMIPFLEDPLGNLGMFIVPAAVLGLSFAGINMRLLRTMVLEVLRQDYVRTAWAKGLKERVVVVRHVLKNAMVPVVTVWGLQIRGLIGGAVIVETIFALPGLGRLMLSSTMDRDYTMVTGIMIILAVFVVFLNLIVDLTYAWLDPRIHYR